MSDQDKTPDEPISFETHTLWDFSNPEEHARADPAAKLTLEVLMTMLREAGPLVPGQIREVESSGTIVLHGVRYEVRMVLQAALPVPAPPQPPVIPPDDLDVYRRD